jgi:hypothetical protein
MLYTRRIFYLYGTRSQDEQYKNEAASSTSKCKSSYALEQFKKFRDRHLVKGEHDVRMFLDPETNHFALFCLRCEPQMVNLMETRH